MTSNDRCPSIALITVDQKREYFVTEKRYELWRIELEPQLKREPCSVEGTACTREELYQELKNFEQQMQPDGCAIAVLKAVIRVVVVNWTEVLGCLNDVLEEIDLALSGDDIFRKSIHVWRQCFGLWRRDLLHYRAFVTDLLQRLEPWIYVQTAFQCQGIFRQMWQS